MSLIRYAIRLKAAVEAEDEAALQELCFDLEYNQLGKKRWPAEVIDFFIDALRDAQICRLNGSAGFLTSLYNDFDKFAPEQRTVLLQVLNDGADGFGDQMLRHAAGDLVARMYPVSVALHTFDHWMVRGTPHRLHMAQVGLEVLAIGGRLEPADAARVHASLQRLEHRRD
jgi:hypothetical protein